MLTYCVATASDSNQITISIIFTPVIKFIQPSYFGISSLEELHFMKDPDIELLCHNTKHPGGVHASDGESANLGHMISQCAEKNIKLAAY